MKKKENSKSRKPNTDKEGSNKSPQDNSDKSKEKSFDIEFDKFKEFNFDHDEKIKLINDFNKECVYPSLLKIFGEFEKKIEENNKADRIKINIEEDYPFSFLLKSMKDELNDINDFFENFDYIKKKLENVDYNLFINEFLKKMYK